MAIQFDNANDTTKDEILQETCFEKAYTNVTSQ